MSRTQPLRRDEVMTSKGVKRKINFQEALIEARGVLRILGDDDSQNIIPRERLNDIIIALGGVPLD